MFPSSVSAHGPAYMNDRRGRSTFGEIRETSRSALNETQIVHRAGRGRALRDGTSEERSVRRNCPVR